METLRPADFDGDHLRRDGLWGVCFSAEWCPFCQDFTPGFRALDDDRDFQIGLADLSDLDNALWERFAIEIVPTLVAFREGRAVWRRDGVAGEGLAASDLNALRQILVERSGSDAARLSAGVHGRRQRPSPQLD